MDRRCEGGVARYRGRGSRLSCAKRPCSDFPRDGVFRGLEGGRLGRWRHPTSSVNAHAHCFLVLILLWLWILAPPPLRDVGRDSVRTLPAWEIRTPVVNAGEACPSRQICESGDTPKMESLSVCQAWRLPDGPRAGAERGLQMTNSKWLTVALVTRNRPALMVETFLHSRSSQGSPGVSQTQRPPSGSCVWPDVAWR